jgi:quinone-modifying oxidoreductase subunit QmoA
MSQTLIIGGGISGITAAVELAEAGKNVVLVEKEPYMGGNVSHFNNYFPKLCPPACGLEINYSRIRSNPRISYYTGAEVTSMCGSEGDFSVSVALKPRLITNQCTACGKCADICPVERKSELGESVPRKAAYMNSGLSFPMKYTIDEEVCEKEACGKCLEVCDYDAIQLSAQPANITLQAQSVIVASGWQSYPAEKIEEYHYSEESDVVTNVEFEKIMANAQRENKKLGRPSDGSLPRKIAFVQCAGSRDMKHLPYCSAVCCSASVKHALTLAEVHPEIKSEIFFIDLRLTGRNEKLLNRAESNAGITFTKGKVGRISHEENGDQMVIEVEDIMNGKKRFDSFDLVVLATGLVPNQVIPPLVESVYGFNERSQVEGIYPVATARRPMEVSSSVKDATAAALKAMRKVDE